MSDRDEFHFDGDLIYNRGEGWEEEWKKFVDYLFNNSDVIYNSVNCLKNTIIHNLIFNSANRSKHLLQNFENDKDDFISFLFEFFITKPEQVLSTWDPQRCDLVYWVSSQNSLLYKWKAYIRHKNSKEVCWNDKNPVIVNYADKYTTDTLLLPVLTEDVIMKTTIDNLDTYCKENSLTQNTQQAALQLYTRLSEKDGTGIAQILQKLLEAVSDCNPNESADGIIRECHQAAQIEYQQKNDELSGKAKKKESKYREKIERELCHNYNKFLFWPIIASMQHRLLHYSTNNAHKRVSEYRLKLLPILMSKLKCYL